MVPALQRGTRRMQDGEFLLMDYAPDAGYYMSDVTRVWPVNGKFNDWQSELYDFYLSCYRAILKAIRPGVRAAIIKQEAAIEMAKILEQSEFSKTYHHTAGAPRTGRENLHSPGGCYRCNRNRD